MAAARPFAIVLCTWHHESHLPRAPADAISRAADGATGYTGTLTAKYLAARAPDLRWAICGRSLSKLTALADQLYAINPGLKGALGVLTDSGGLNAVTRQATVGITTTGPFFLHGEPFLKACIEEGTHYIDATGPHLPHRVTRRVSGRPAPCPLLLQGSFRG